MRLKLRANTIASLDIRFPPGHYLRLDSISLQLSISRPSSSTPFLPTRFFPWAIYTNCYSPRICLDTSGCLLCQECFLYPAHDLVGGEVGGQSETSDGKHETEMNRTSSLQSRLAVWGLKLCGGRERYRKRGLADGKFAEIHVVHLVGRWHAHRDANTVGDCSD